MLQKSNIAFVLNSLNAISGLNYLYRLVMNRSALEEIYDLVQNFDQCSSTIKEALKSIQSGHISYYFEKNVYFGVGSSVSAEAPAALDVWTNAATMMTKFRICAREIVEKKEQSHTLWQWQSIWCVYDDWRRSQWRDLSLLLNTKDDVCWLFQSNRSSVQWPLLLTWFNFNPSMDK